MDIRIALLAAVAGYLLGSFSFMRLITRLVAPGRGIERTVVAVPDSDIRIESDAISATTARLQLGTGYGCLVGALDILKAALPALAFRLWQPEVPYYLVAAGMATVGHIWPVYYRFRGGRGLSPIVGGMLVMDPLGTLVTNLAALPLFLPMKNRLFMGSFGIVFMIAWTALVRRDLAQGLYVVAMNLLFWSAMLPELREFGRLRREGTLETFEQAHELRVIGAAGEERIAGGTLPALRARILARFRRS